MSLYNMLFGMNSQAPLLLAIIGLKEHDVERFRDVYIEDEGRTIAVYTRTGGGNREDYPQVALYRNPLFKSTEDDDFDSTYATFRFNTPSECVEDVRNLSDVITHGIRKEFVAHLAKTLNREATEGDKSAAAYQAEKTSIDRLAHFNANGHTFVPHNDTAMAAALKIAEANGGELRTCWGILPLQITIKRDFFAWPNAKAESDRKCMTRVEIGYEWEIDEDYWQHCVERWSSEFPLSMAKIAESVARHLESRTKKRT